jgi:hypothetical protein
MAFMTYGTPEFYKERFMDFLADAQFDEPEYGEAIIKGFLLALDDWKSYHANQATHYAELRERIYSPFTLS